MIRRNLRSIVGGLALAGAAFQLQAATTNVVSLTTFDPAAAAGFDYGYFYGNNGLGSYTVNRAYYLPEDVDLTNGMYQLTFDITDLNGMTGFGVGAGAPLFRADTDPALFVSGDRANYTFTFDARADGVTPGQTAAGEMQVQFYRKDDNGQDVKTLQVNLPFQATANWQMFSFKLDQGSLGDNTVDADFELYHLTTSDLRFNVNYNDPFNSFGYDGDNAVYFDNVKLEVVDAGLPPGPVPERAETIVDWNMDADGKIPYFEYNYEYSGNDQHLTRAGGNNANNTNPNTLGVGGSSAWFLTIDNSVFAGNVPPYAGAGTGGGGPVDYTKFNSTNLASYRISFDARVEGLAEGRENTSAALQLFLDAPDDTVLPADENADADRVTQLNFNVARLTPEFQHYSFDLSKGGVGGGSKENFAAYFDKISDLRTQWQIENAGSEADWGFDAGNSFIIDNIRVERIYIGLDAIAFAREGNELVLNWTAAATGTTKLQAATTIDGTFSDVATTGTTYRTEATGKERYFRLVWEAPAAGAE